MKKSEIKYNGSKYDAYEIELETQEDNENLTYFTFDGEKYQVKLGTSNAVRVTIVDDERLPQNGSVQCVQKKDGSYLAWRLGGNVSWNR